MLGACKDSFGVSIWAADGSRKNVIMFPYKDNRVSSESQFGRSVRDAGFCFNASLRADLALETLRTIDRIASAHGDCVSGYTASSDPAHV